jgi:hypothetical protein
VLVAATAIPPPPRDIGLRAELERAGISVKAYGAKGNGSNNDTAAVQRAFNAAARDHKNVSFSGWQVRPRDVEMKNGIRELHGHVCARGKHLVTVKQRALGADMLRTQCHHRQLAL